MDSGLTYDHIKLAIAENAWAVAMERRVRLDREIKRMVADLDQLDHSIDQMQYRIDRLRQELS